MDTPLYSAYLTYKSARRRLDDAERELAAAKEDYSARDDDLMTEARKRRVNVNRGVDLDCYRRKVNNLIRLAMIPPDDSWIHVPINGPYEDAYCKWAECACRADPNARSAFSGYYESAYARGHPEERTCDVCFGRVCDSRQEAMDVSNQELGMMCVEHLLACESRDRLFRDEAAEERVARALLPEEWRALVPPVNCDDCYRNGRQAPALFCRPSRPFGSVCADHRFFHPDGDGMPWTKVVRFQACVVCGDETPAAYILVGFPTLRLCDGHYEGRADLTDVLVRHARTPPAPPPIAVDAAVA